MTILMYNKASYFTLLLLYFLLFYFVKSKNYYIIYIFLKVLKKGVVGVILNNILVIAQYMITFCWTLTKKQNRSDLFK